MFRWSRYGGYECSSKGDKRFSAMFARMPDGRTVEMHYQCDIKGYDPGGTDWRIGKGEPPLIKYNDEQLYLEYKNLWGIWSENNLPLMRELYKLAKAKGNCLSDRFATSPINQARALSEILNYLCKTRQK